MNIDKQLKLIEEEASVLKDAETKLYKLRNDASRMNDRIKSLQEKMKENPSYETAQELGSLIQGKEHLTLSLDEYEEEYEKLDKRYSNSLKNQAMQVIRVKLEKDSEVAEDTKKLTEAINNLIEVSAEVDENFYNKRQQIMDEIDALGAGKYVNSIFGVPYPDPYFNAKNLPNDLIGKLNWHLEGLEKQE